MSLFLAEDLMLPLLPPIHATTKKERNFRFSPLSTQSRGRSAKHSREHQCGADREVEQ